MQRNEFTTASPRTATLRTASHRTAPHRNAFMTPLRDDNPGLWAVALIILILLAVAIAKLIP